MEERSWGKRRCWLGATTRAPRPSSRAASTTSFACIVDRYGFDDSDIVVLIDTDDSYTQPTGANVRRAIFDLVAGSRPGNVLFSTTAAMAPGDRRRLGRTTTLGMMSVLSPVI